MILVVTEGRREEPALFRKIERLGLYGDHAQVVAYGTNIYSLIRLISSYELDISNQFDISLVLREVERIGPNAVNQGVDLNYHFSDILVVFDLDPQDPNFDFKAVELFVSRFSSDTTTGKVYINYPMFESLFLDRLTNVCLEKLKKKGWFKEYAHKTESWREFRELILNDNKDFDKISMEYILNCLSCQNCLFLEIVGKTYIYSDMNQLLNCQNKYLKLNNEIVCINSSILSILDFDVRAIESA